MSNIWLKKKKREDARQALQNWCNREAYDSFGFYANKTLVKMRARFFKKHPEYREFDMELRVTWNLHHEGGHPTRASKNVVSDPPPTWPNDATGIPEVTFYPNGYWEYCAEIAKRAIPNYYYEHIDRVWIGDKIAKAITECTHKIYRRAKNLKPKEDAKKHARDRLNKFWDDIVIVGRDS